MVGGGGAVHGGSVVGGGENGRRRQFVGTRVDSFDVGGEEVTTEVMPLFDLDGSASTGS